MARDISLMGRLARYGVVGIATNLPGYGIFLSILWSGLPPTLATGVTYVLAVGLSYIANRTWSFQSTASHRNDAPRYAIAYGIGLGVAMLSMYALSAWIRPEIAQILVIGITAGVIFTVLELLKFGK